MLLLKVWATIVNDWLSLNFEHAIEGTDWSIDGPCFYLRNSGKSENADIFWCVF